jgi:hypothetical protein
VGDWHGLVVLFPHTRLLYRDALASLIAECAQQEFRTSSDTTNLGVPFLLCPALGLSNMTTKVSTFLGAELF